MMPSWRHKIKATSQLIVTFHDVVFLGFVGIVYSFGIEMRPQGLDCSLELPEEEIIPTSEENFAALRVILDRVQQAVVPAK